MVKNENVICRIKVREVKREVIREERADGVVGEEREEEEEEDGEERLYIGCKGRVLNRVLPYRPWVQE